MWAFITGIFLVLYGLVHLLYAGQSGRYFELSSGMTWSDGSWLFSKFLGDESTRLLATRMLVRSALTFVAGGFGFFFNQEWWCPVAISAVSLSPLIFILFWDGLFHELAENGGIDV